MLTFSYVITDSEGIHARPAGELVKLVKGMDSKVTLTSAGKSANAAKVLAIMSLGAKYGQTVDILVEGGDEAGNLAKLEAFMKENL